MTCTFGAAAGVAGFSAARAAASSGLPGLAASSRSLLANATGAAGGARFATTRRCSTAAGGALALPAAAAPSTLARVGAIAATDVTGTLTNIAFVVGTATLDTCCDCTNAVAGTATTAPGTC